MSRARVIPGSIRVIAMLVGLFGAVMALSGPVQAQSEQKIAIKGYDPVAYFTLGRATLGSPEFEHVWHGMRWRFASKAHLEKFASDPVRYAPQYDGFCAMGMAMNGKPYEVDPEAWAVVDGKLYLTFNRDALERWRKNAKENIERADAAWQASRKTQ